MSITYTPTTNFAGKDSLPSNDSNKVVKGAEFTTEFTAIQSAFALAAPSSTPTFTGTATFDSLTVTSNFTSRGIDDNATSTAITIDANENVGIGDAPVSGSRKLMVKDTADTRVDIRSGSDTNLGAIDFSDTSNTARGQLVYDHSDDSMAFRTLSAEAMRIDALGNVGIGTSDPADALHLYAANPELIVQCATTSFSAQDSGITMTGRDTATNGPRTATQWRMANKGADLHFSYGGSATPSMLISRASGNVGIGTDNPTQALTVSRDSGSTYIEATRATQGQGQVAVQLVGGTGGTSWAMYQDTGSDSLSFYGNGSDRMTVSPVGNVGIGTTDPASSYTGSSKTLQLEHNNAATVVLNNTATAGSEWEISSQLDGSMTFRKDTAVQMTLSSTGNVGIGESAPEGVLHIKKASYGGVGAVSSSADDFIVEGATNTGLTIQTPNTSKGSMFFQDPESSAAGFIQYDHNDDTMRLGTTGTEKVRIDASGNVGIGNTNPTFLLDVSGTVGSTVATRSNNTGSALNLHRYENTSASGATAPAVGSDGADAVVYTNNAESMRIDSNGDVTMTSSTLIQDDGVNGRLTIGSDTGLNRITSATTNFGSYQLLESRAGSYTWRIGAAAAAMTLDASGNLLVGVSAPADSKLGIRSNGTSSSFYALNILNGSGTGLLSVRDDGAVNTGGATKSPYNNTSASTANLVVNSAGFLERSTSSLRYKENVRDYTGSIDALRPVMFNSINEGDDKDYAGFIAEEVDEAGLTEFVQYDDQDRPDAVNYANMVALLVKEVQDLKAKVEALENA